MIKSKLFISVLLLFSIAVYGQTDEWRIIGNMATPVAEGELVFYQQDMYMLGGYSDAYQSEVNSIRRYNIEQNTWTSIGTMVLPRKSFAAVSYNREIFSIGGLSGDNTGSSGIEVFNYDFSEIINTHSNYFNRYYSSGVLFGRELFIIGGNPANINPSINNPYIYKYDLRDDIVTNVENEYFAFHKLPEQQMAEIYQDEIYIFGGVFNGISDDIYKYDINDSTLVKLSVHLSEPRAAGQAIRLSDENIILIIGGYNETNDVLSSMEFFRIDNYGYHHWTGPSLNVPRKNFMVSQYQHKIYVMGGYDDRGDVLSSIEVFEPELTDIEKESKLPEEINLNQNYPNPFNPSTEISFTLPEQTRISLDIYSSIGEHILCLKSGNYAAGNYSVTWNAKNSIGQSVSSGIYFYTLTTDKKEYAKKMILLK
jgi:hypothetical protein